MPTMNSTQVSPHVLNLPASSTIAVSAKAKELKAQGIDVVGFGTGEPDFDTPQHIIDSLVAAVNAGHTRYAPSPGSPECREVIARKLRDLLDKLPVQSVR